MRFPLLAIQRKKNRSTVIDMSVRRKRMIRLKIAGERLRSGVVGKGKENA
jgi:hypothetical protein